MSFSIKCHFRLTDLNLYLKASILPNRYIIEFQTFNFISFIHTSTGSRSPVWFKHLKNFPPKNCTPIIENINQKTRQTKSTLKMEGIAYMRAFTTIRMPCHREIARNGRRARSVRSDRSTFKFSFSSMRREKTDTCEHIQRK